MWLVLATLLTVIVFLYWKLKENQKFWIRRGVKQGAPVPLLGDKWGPVLRKQSLSEMVMMVYNYCPNRRYFGIYDFLSPVLILKDPELIKRITVKDFDHFTDHRSFLPEGSDLLFASNLFMLTGKRWRDMRTALSPSFTGSKLKQMFVLIQESGQQLVNFFWGKNEDLVEVELKDTFTRFANDVIASTAFGVQVDSLQNPENEFYKTGKAITDFVGFWKTVRILGFFLMPKIYNYFKINLFEPKLSNFFLKLVKESIEQRQRLQIKRPDMIDLLLEARNSPNPQTDIEFTDEMITAQALIFFFAGFDTVSSAMCFMCHELAVNPLIQQKLQSEIDEIQELSYETLTSLKYLDMVLQETLRKWPITPVVDRVCTKPYTIQAENNDEVSLYIKEKQRIWLPFIGLHRDPKYFPDPDRFDPERFREKGDVRAYTYLPFGAGPRGCIASRFALVEIKVLFFYLLKGFEVVPVPRTKEPLVLSKSGFNMTAEDGFWVGLRKRDS